MSNAAPLGIEAVASGGVNFGLKDEIRAYWTRLAAIVALSRDHRIRSDAELEAWARMIAPGRGETARAACGSRPILHPLRPRAGLIL
ncbi:hypothetical protein CYD53_106267 [Bosea psychrotolerans]|uniref:Uncharacterized protein n=1 Tax=Bosea psychrotolerans TaxID=1871628 RepID=A0A2S4MB48_9HYPH|nr:hypothetical protein CYD53_106267 [Bosea psychrotolerans]